MVSVGEGSGVIVAEGTGEDVGLSAVFSFPLQAINSSTQIAAITILYLINLSPM
jgi:hypothetical protein